MCQVCYCPNKRLKLPARRRLRNDSFFSAPQLKRDSLGCASRHKSILCENQWSASMSWQGSVGQVRFDPRRFPMRVSWRAGRGNGCELRAGGPFGIVTPALRRAALSAPCVPGEGRTRALTCGAQPNQRLKLAAPVPKDFGGPLRRRCGRIPFVNTLSLRRSLSAIR